MLVELTRRGLGYSLRKLRSYGLKGSFSFFALQMGLLSAFAREHGISNVPRFASIVLKNRGVICGKEKTYLLNRKEALEMAFAAFLKDFKANYRFFYTLRKLRVLGGQLKGMRGNYFVADFDGIEWHIRPFVTSDIYGGPLLPYHEFLAYKWFDKIMRKEKEPVFIDIGAYIGGYSVRAAKLGAFVVAVEPAPDNFEVLKANVEGNGLDVTLVGKAIARERGTAFMDYGREPMEFSIQEKGIPVESERLDDLVDNLGLSGSIDLVKVDVEGAEQDVVLGGLKTLRRTKFLIIEVWKENRNVHSMLKKLGFRLLALRSFDSFYNVVYSRR